MLKKNSPDYLDTWLKENPESILTDPFWIVLKKYEMTSATVTIRDDEFEESMKT